MNNKIEEKLLVINGPAINVAKPKKIPKNNGIKIKEKGIRNLKFSSKVNE